MDTHILQHHDRKSKQNNVERLKQPGRTLAQADDDRAALWLEQFSAELGDMMRALYRALEGTS